MEQKKSKTEETLKKLEQGLSELFESDKYKNYLKVMGRFHNYSFSNTLLIAMQKPDATYVAGYQDWSRKFHRKVSLGEKGIAIIAPIVRKVKRWEEDLDENGQRQYTADGRVKKKEVEQIKQSFQTVHVFDISQTTGEALPTIGVDELKGRVENFEDIYSALVAFSPVEVRLEKIKGGAKGYYSLTEDVIVIKEGMDEMQELKTGIHELGHKLLHSGASLIDGVEDEKKARNIRELEAESVAYAVCSFFGIDSSEYSFPYLASWSSKNDTTELKQSLNRIRKATDYIINGLNTELRKIQEQKMAETPVQKETVMEEKTSRKVKTR